MRYIPISQIEEIINLDKIKNLYKQHKNYNGNYSLTDYMANIESYIYAYLMLEIKSEQTIYIINIMEKYIDGLIIPLSKKDPLIFLKSKLCKIIIKIYNNIGVEINSNCIKYIKEFPHSNLYMSFTGNKKKIKSKIIELKSITLLSSYIEITNDTKFLFETYYNIKKMRKDIINSKLKLYFSINEIPRKFMYEDEILLEILEIKENITKLNNNIKSANKSFIIKRILKLKDEDKIILLKNPNFIVNNTDLMMSIISTLNNKKTIDISGLSNYNNIDYEDYRLLYSFFNKEEIKAQLHKNIELKNIAGIKGIFINLEVEDSIKTIEKIYVNKIVLLEYISQLSKPDLKKIITNINFINYLKKYNYVILISKLNMNEQEKRELINNQEFRNKYKVNKIDDFKNYLNKIIEEINYKINKKPTDIKLIDTIYFYGKFDNYYIIQDNIFQIIEAIYTKKYNNLNIDNETSINLLKEFLKIIDF